MTRSVYSSSSFVPATIASAVVTAEAISAVTSAHQKRVDLDRALGQRVGGREHERVRDQNEQERRRDRERQPERRQERRHDRVQHSDHERCEERRPEAADVETREDRGRDVDRDGTDDPADQEPAGPQLRADVGAARLAPVLGCCRASDMGRL